MNVTWLKFGSDNPEMDANEQRAASEEFSDDKPTGRRQSRAEAKRNEIIKVARDQFLKNGFDGTSVDSIVDVLGGSKSTIYSHFGNKEGLFAAVIRDFGHASDSPDFPIMDGNIRNELFAFALDRQKRVLSPLNINIMRIVIAEAARQPGIADLYFRNAPEPTYAVLKDYLRCAVENGSLVIEYIDIAAEEFLGGLLQRRILARLFGVEKNITDAELREHADDIVNSFIAKYASV